MKNAQRRLLTLIWKVIRFFNVITSYSIHYTKLYEVAAFVAAHPEVKRARVVATREGEMDAMTVRIESDATDAARYAAGVVEALKLKGAIEIA